MPRKALSLLRKDIVYRHEAFRAGLAEAGCEVVDSLDRPAPGDVLLIWNRYGDFDVRARMFEARGATVLVTENGWLGKHWLGQEWFTLCGGHHAGAGTWPVGDDSRWDGWGVGLDPWRIAGERVILGQRGIGEPGIASPPGWAERTFARYGGRIRIHPGKRADAVKSLEEDLVQCGEVLTWNSGAALKALMLGIPVRYDYPRWIGAYAAVPLESPTQLLRSDRARLQMFRRLAWSMWTLDEIRGGLPFKRILQPDS